MPDEATVKTVENMTPKPNSFKNLLNGVRDIASLELRKPVKARLLNRMKELEELTSANTIGIDIAEDNREFITEPPKIFAMKLTSEIRNGVGVITYYKYKTQKNPETGELEKASRVLMRKSPVTGQDIEHNREFIVDVLVRETIEHGKPIKVEELNYNG